MLAEYIGEYSGECLYSVFRLALFHSCQPTSFILFDIHRTMELLNYGRKQCILCVFTKDLDTSDWLLNIVMHIKELVKTFNSSFARRDFYIEKAIVRVQNLVYMSTSAPILS